jgi:PIN domain nuclease of toxin-antitoxin system
MPYVADTHSLVWHFTNSTNLSTKAKKTFQRAESGEDTIYIPCIVFFELLYLVEKRKTVVDFEGFISLISSASNYQVEPLCLPIINKTKLISRDVISDPWDRLIAATSLHLGYPLISKDETLRKAGLELIW